MGGSLASRAVEPGLSLVFANGIRPSVDDVVRAMQSNAGLRPLAQVSHSPGSDEGWLELLASGLTFELRGLNPGPSAKTPPRGQLLGLMEHHIMAGAGVLTLVPGPHLAGGAALLPVVRVMTGLVAALASALGANMVCWHPAQSWMEAGYFVRIVENWLGGGAFPALGLTALVPDGGGAIISQGLAWFTGQETSIAPLHDDEPRADSIKRAVRVVDHLVRHGPITSDLRVEGAEGEDLLLSPSPDGTRVTVTLAGA